MSEPTNLLIFIHGMTSEPDPPPPTRTYTGFWNGLLTHRPDLPGKIAKRVFVEWGNDFHKRSGALPHTDPPGGNLPDDQKLTETEKFIHGRVSYRKASIAPGPNNVVIHQGGIPLVRTVATKLREEVLIFGMSDVMYYVSSGGEKRVRLSVYRQALGELDEFLSAPDVRFHLVGQSLGVALTHDFLFGLFNCKPDENGGDYVPDFLRQAEEDDPATVRRFESWRRKAQEGTLTLGSLTSMASQLPLFVMRKQTMVDRLYNQQLLDPAVIGIHPGDQVKWKIFYDIDDILAFPTRNLYYPNHSIMDVQVSCGDWPQKAHSAYWNNETVLREAAELIWENC